jgi:hypothetical protein
MPMNWQTVWEIIQKYWVQQLCVITLGMITW